MADRISTDPPSQQDPPIIVGTSEAICEVRRLVEQAAARSCDVFLTGEPGTGKELVARVLHELQGTSAPFVRIDACSPPGVLDSKIFGPKPAGTSIFLHEVADLAPTLQEHLKLALEERDRKSPDETTPFSSVRLSCSSTRDLVRAGRDGSFDAALHQRLSGFTIRMPTLRSRREDIPLLLEHFVHLVRRELGHDVEGFSPAAIEMLIRRSWLGNVRELYEYVRTTVVLSPTKIIEPMDLWLPRGIGEPGSEPWQLGYRELRKRVLLRFEADFVARVLKAASGNVSMAARLAKIDRKHLWRLIQRTGIRLEKFDK